ncbi:MAG: hypothetical protein JNM27_10640 [Leptospirales bacterium]|nr:hypothetical protein [Leptospirales bacterium]
MKSYRFTLRYEGKKTSSVDNKIGPIVRKYNGTYESKYNFEDNETIVTVNIAKKEDKAKFETDLKSPDFTFLTLERVVLILDEEE